MISSTVSSAASSAAVRSAEQTQREVAAQYRRATGRERPPPRWDATARAAWRTVHRDAGVIGAWTHTPAPSAVALLLALDEATELVGGTVLAARAGVSQGHATSVTLPRFSALDLANAAVGEPSRPGARRPLLWVITDAGRELAAVMRAGQIG